MSITDEAMKTLRHLARTLGIPLRHLVVLPDERDLARPIELVRKVSVRKVAKSLRKRL